MPSDRRARPLGWQAIRDEALRRIRTGQWPLGAQIPNEADLATEFGCARATVNRALRDLADAGVLERRRKGGTRVAPTPLRKATLEIPVIQREVEGRGGRYGYALIARDLCPPPRGVSERMGLAADMALLHLRALHLCDDAPHVYEDRWVNPHAVPAILQVDFGHVSANAWLVRNVPYTRGALALGAMGADEAVSAALQCPPGSAVFTMERLTWMGAAPITLVTQHYAPGYRLTTSI